MKPHRNCGLNFGTFATQSGYEELDERKQLTAAKWRLLLVLEHPELPLHNNPAELELGQSCCDVILAMVLKRRMVLRLGILLCPLLLRLVSWELVFFEYVRDRITRTENIESLAQIIRNKTALICLVGRGRQNNHPDY